jgi:CheY-like chemotaxis protein
MVEPARVAKLADASALGADGSNTMEVQVLSRAQLTKYNVSGNFLLKETIPMKTALIVDDLKLNLDILAAHLERFGMTVLRAKDGEEALEIFRQNPNLDFVVTDWNMPKKDGVQLITELRELRPNLPIMLSSGNQDEMSAADKEKIRGVVILPKPFTREDLIRALLPIFTS